MISDTVMVPTGEAVLTGDLVVAGPVRSVVLLVRGSGSARSSAPNRTVATELRKAALGTLLLDLLTEREERTDASKSTHRFDIPLLGQRLVAAIDWLDQQPDTAGVPVGLFAANTAAAAALQAAAERPARVHAVVCRDGRPDLAGDALEQVRTPVLMITSDNEDLLGLNRQTAERLSPPHKIHVVRGSTPLSAEPEAVHQVATAAREWYVHPGADQPNAA
ncbi:hydrolase [Streptomyces sp. HC44]|uniref:Hydrolase n=1 Tax=Streptomyces scabichelini TaxID=2711217 RepID=A0A6G4VDL4_9ACTN|nr:hydrolase [Streptomyces scabichelini]NGO11883.1 hydrolase [Streptomyces scabichelini]